MKFQLLLITLAITLGACVSTQTGTIRYPDGTKRVVYDYTLDQSGQTRQGHYREWYRDGQLKMDGHFDQGQRHGQWSEWYENGQKRYEGGFEHAKPVGIVTLWFPDGRRMAVLDYTADAKVPIKLHRSTRDNSSTPEGKPSVSAAELSARVHALRPEFKRCYKRGLQSRPGLTGKVVLTWEIDLTGRAFATQSSWTLEHRPTETCIVEVANNARFPNPSDRFLIFTKTFVLGPDE